MILGVDPKVDYAFRKLFATPANSDLLVDLLNAILQHPPDQRIVSAEILTPFNTKDTEADKETILDIKARDQLGRQYNVEMEMSPAQTFPQRLLYYWAVVHAGQLTVGEDYSQLRPTISICFVNRVLFPETPDCHLDFQLRSSRRPELIFCPQQVLHVVELPKFEKNIEGVIDPFDVWCYFLKNGASLDPENLPASFTRAAVPKAMEVLMMLKQSELEWHRYQSQLKAQRDKIADRLDALEEGQLIGQIRAYQRMLKRSVTPVEDLLALSFKEVEAKAAALEQEAAARLDGNSDRP